MSTGCPFLCLQQQTWGRYQIFQAENRTVWQNAMMQLTAAISAHGFVTLAGGCHITASTVAPISSLLAWLRSWF